MIVQNIKSTLTCSCSECESACCFGKRNYNKSYYYPQKVKLMNSESKVKNLFNNTTNNLNKGVKEKLKKDTTCKIVSKGPILYNNVYHSNEKINRTNKEHSYVIVSNRPSITIDYSHEGHEDPAINLTAEIMNIEPDKVVTSGLCKDRNVNNKLEKHDLYNKIIDIYKECSCEICECIVDSSLPCDCVDSLKKNIKNISHKSCSCKKCDAKNCTGLIEKIENMVRPVVSNSEYIGDSCALPSDQYNMPSDPFDYIDYLKLYDNSFLNDDSSYIKCDKNDGREVVDEKENILEQFVNIIDSSLLPSNKTVSDPLDSIDSLKLYDKSVSLGCHIRYERKNYINVVKKIDKFVRPFVSTCECEPCKCIKCVDNFTKPCQCKSCQCVECKSFLKGFSKQTAIVASAMESLQQNVCQCSPCECLNCTQNVEAMSMLSTREISTGMSDLTRCQCDPCSIDTCQMNTINCTCESRSRITRKPTDKNINEYDIRSAVISKKTQFLKDKNDVIRNVDPIHKFISRYEFSNTLCDVGICKCQNCECIICKHNKNYENIGDETKKNPLTEVVKSNNCKCSPCDCKICDKFRSEEDVYSESFNRSCRCKVCDCISCCNLYFNEKSKHRQDRCINSFLRQYSKDDCKCEQCECTECADLKFSTSVLNNENKSIVDILFENLYPVKKGKLLTPEMFEANESQLMKSKKTMESQIPIDKNTLLTSNQDIVKRSNCSQTISNLNTRKSVSFKKMNHDKSSNTKISAINKDSSKYKNTSINKDQAIKNEILTNYMTEEKKINNKIFECDYQGNVIHLKNKSSLNIIFDNGLFQSNDSLFNKSTMLASTDSDLAKNDIERNSMKDSKIMQRAKQLVKDSDEYTAYLLDILEKSRKDNEDLIRVSEKNLSSEFYQENSNRNEEKINVAVIQTNYQYQLMNDLVNYTNEKEITKNYDDKVTKRNMATFDHDIPTLSSMKKISFRTITENNELILPLINIINSDTQNKIPLPNKTMENNNDTHDDEKLLNKHLDSGISAVTETNIEENIYSKDTEICLSSKELLPVIFQIQPYNNNFQTDLTKREFGKDLVEQQDALKTFHRHTSLRKLVVSVYLKLNESSRLEDRQ